MTLWMLWATGVSALLALAALVVEKALRALGREGRWAWVGAIVGATALQVWSLVSQAGWVGPTAVTGRQVNDALVGLPLFIVDGIAVATVTAPALLERLEPFALAAWLLGSTLLSAGLLGGLWRLRRAANQWRGYRVADHDVLVSEDFGPALVGVWAPRIVLPRWALRLSDEALRITCIHEAEHRAAHDTWLLFAGASLAALTPWNAAIWWQVSRLRQAVEMDYDHRVLRGGVPRSTYGALLLERGVHPHAFAASVAALAQPTSLLERRLTMMMTDVKRGGPFRLAGAVVMTALLTVVACETPAPTAIQPAPDPDAEAVPATAISETSQKVGEVVSDMIGGSTIRIRGNASSSDIIQPLVYIDGIRIAYEEAIGLPLELINPNDVDRIEIVKGGAALELYGEEAAGGVIQIFTKKRAMDRPEDTADQIEWIRRQSAEAGVEPTPDMLRRRNGEAEGFDPAQLERAPNDVGLDNAEIYVDGDLFSGDITDLDRDLIDRVEVVKGADGDKIFFTMKPRGKVKFSPNGGD